MFKCDVGEAQRNDGEGHLLAKVMVNAIYLKANPRSEYSARRTLFDKCR